MNVYGRMVLTNITLNYLSLVDVVIIGLFQIYGCCNPKSYIFYILNLLVYLKLDLQIIVYDTSLE